MRWKNWLARSKRTRPDSGGLWLAWMLAGLMAFPCPFARGEEVLPAAVHDALAGALAENPGRVSSIRSMVDSDAAKNPAESSGMEDDLAVLEILSASTTQKEKGIQLRRLAGKMNDPVAKERLLKLASGVPSVEIEDLIRKRKLNKYTTVLNRTWQTASETLAGQPRAIAVAGTDSFFALTGRAKPSVADRKIAYLAQLRESDGEASGEELAESREIVASMEKKKSDLLLKDWKKSIKASMKNNQNARAIRLCRLGGNLWPEEKTAFEESAQKARDAMREPSPETIEAPSAPAGDDPGMMIVRKKLIDSEPLPETIEVDAAMNPVADAMAARRSKTLNYLLFGETGFGISEQSVARSIAQHGTDAPAALGLIQGAQTLFRGVTLMFGNELGLEQAIDSYAEVERTNPGALTEKDIHKWAELCVKAGRFKEALDLLERHGIQDEKKKHKIRARWGEAIVDRCKDLPQGEDRFQALKFVTTELADTSSAKKAQRLLEETPSVDKPLVQVKREDLQNYESMLVAAGMDFKPEWHDGDSDNGEIDEEGIFWDPDGILYFRTGKRSAWRSIQQNPSDIEKLKGAFAQVEDAELARNLANDRAKDRKFPLEIEGQLGPGSSYVTPKVVGYDINRDDDGLFQ